MESIRCRPDLVGAAWLAVSIDRTGAFLVSVDPAKVVLCSRRLPIGEWATNERTADFRPAPWTDFEQRVSAGPGESMPNYFFLLEGPKALALRHNTAEQWSGWDSIEAVSGEELVASNQSDSAKTATAQREPVGTAGSATTAEGTAAATDPAPADDSNRADGGDDMDRAVVWNEMNDCSVDFHSRDNRNTGGSTGRLVVDR